MSKFQNLFAFGTLAVAALLFAGCGTTADTVDDTTPTTTETEDADGSDTSSVGTNGDFQLVSLKVPNMT